MRTLFLVVAPLLMAIDPGFGAAETQRHWNPDMQLPQWALFVHSDKCGVSE